MKTCRRAVPLIFVVTALFAPVLGLSQGTPKGSRSSAGDTELSRSRYDLIQKTEEPAPAPKRSWRCMKLKLSASPRKFTDAGANFTPGIHFP